MRAEEARKLTDSDINFKSIDDVIQDIYVRIKCSAEVYHNEKLQIVEQLHTDMFRHIEHYKTKIFEILRKQGYSVRRTNITLSPMYIIEW